MTNMDSIRKARELFETLKSNSTDVILIDSSVMKTIFSNEEISDIFQENCYLCSLKIGNKSYYKINEIEYAINVLINEDRDYIK